MGDEERKKSNKQNSKVYKINPSNEKNSNNHHGLPGHGFGPRPGNARFDSPFTGSNGLGQICGYTRFILQRNTGYQSAHSHHGSGRNVHAITAGNVSYIGEWHSHPNGASLNRSDDDDNLFEWLQRHMRSIGRPPLMLIAGDKGNFKFYTD